MAAFDLAGNIARGELARIGGVHFQRLVNEVGPITEAEVDAKMAEAAQIHAREWDRSPHPADAAVPTPAHDWAVRHIAANLVARERGYNPDGWHPRRSYAPVVRARPALTVPHRVGEEA